MAAVNVGQSTIDVKTVYMPCDSREWQSQIITTAQ